MLSRRDKTGVLYYECFLCVSIYGEGDDTDTDFVTYYIDDKND